jgi:hypothetical protein
MAVMLHAQYEVADVGRFLEAFDGYEDTRRRAGATSRGVLSPADEPSVMVALIGFGTREEAEAFAADPGRAATLKAAGVRRTTDRILEVVRPVAPVGPA